MTQQVMVTMTSDVHDEVMTRTNDPSPDAPLRMVLRINGATSGLGGAIAAIAPVRLDDVLGTGEQGWVRLIGVGLVAFAALTFATARSHDAQLVRVVPAISLGDAAWVIGTILAIALGWFSSAGATVMGLVGVMVGTFAVEQVRLLRSLSESRQTAIS